MRTVQLHTIKAWASELNQWLVNLTNVILTRRGKSRGEEEQSPLHKRHRAAVKGEQRRSDSGVFRHKHSETLFAGQIYCKIDFQSLKPNWESHERSSSCWKKGGDPTYVCMSVVCMCVFVHVCCVCIYSLCVSVCMSVVCVFLCKCGSPVSADAWLCVCMSVVFVCVCVSVMFVSAVYFLACLLFVPACSSLCLCLSVFCTCVWCVCAYFRWVFMCACSFVCVCACLCKCCVCVWA